MDMEYDKTILALLYGYSSRQEIERWYQHQILFQRRDERERHISYGMVEVVGAKAIREGYQTLLPYMDWNIVLGDDVLISYPKIADVQTEICIYPVDLENQMKTAVCTGEEEKIREITKRFHAYFLNGSMYLPKEIKESYVRFQWAVLNIAKEVGCIDYQKVDQKSLLDRIMSAKTEEELQRSFDQLFGHMSMAGKGTEVMSLAVKKTQSMIHEFYADGITLSEIADRLNLTQEKLAEEVGVSTAYIGQIERGERSLTLDKLVKVVNRLGVTIDFLLSDYVIASDDTSINLLIQLMHDRTAEEKTLAINLLKVLFADK